MTDRLTLGDISLDAKHHDPRFTWIDMIDPNGHLGLGGEHGCRVSGTGQVGRHQYRRFQVRERTGRPPRLAEAVSGQLRVKLTLNPLLRVEVSLGMPPEHELPQGHSDSSASAASTSKGIAGQSFHSRSRP